MSNEAEIAKLVGVLAATFPNTNVTDATVEVYVSMLRDVPLDVLGAAVKQCICESEFFPTVTKIRAKAVELTTPRNPLGGESFGDVLKEISRTGFYQSPKFDNPITARCVEIMGWRNLCTSENQTADRARFIQLYDQLVEREKENLRLCPEARALRELTDSLAAIKEIGDGRGF